jgi:hypothetical protein
MLSVNKRLRSTRILRIYIRLQTFTKDQITPQLTSHVLPLTCYLSSRNIKKMAGTYASLRPPIFHPATMRPYMRTLNHE